MIIYGESGHHLSKSPIDHIRYNSGKTSHFPLFLSSQNQKGEKRTVIAGQGHDYDLILLLSWGKLLDCSVLPRRSIFGWNQAKWIYISTCLHSYHEKQSPSSRAVQAVLCHRDREEADATSMSLGDTSHGIYNLFSLLWRVVLIEQRLWVGWLHPLYSSPNTICTITTTLTSSAFRGWWFLQPMPEIEALGIGAVWTTSPDVLSASHEIPWQSLQVY